MIKTKLGAMPKHSVIALLLPFALASSCVHAQESVYLESIRCLGGPYGLQLPRDLRQLRVMAPLLHEKVGEVEHWDGYTVTRRTFYFEGLELGIADFSNDPSKWTLTHAELSGAKWNHRSPFKLGQPVSRAHSLLGAAAKGDGELKRSYGGDGDSLQIRSSAGHVTGVSYRCYSG